jgi:hypothetical protein
MKSVRSIGFSMLLLTSPWCCAADDGTPDCSRAAVAAHVRHQFELYGPLSIRREYFGFIYLAAGTIGSAVARGKTCPSARNCGVNTATAFAQIPPGARVLGEWHTHPKGGSEELSADDVRGAFNNRHIACYQAFYGKPDGEVYAWDPNQFAVPTAMGSRLIIEKRRLVARIPQPNGLSIDSGGVENQIGFSAPMWKQSSSRTPNFPGR